MKVLAVAGMLFLCAFAFWVSHRVLFRHELRHERRVERISEAMPDRVYVSYRCSSMDEMTSMTGKKFLEMAAGDFYFRKTIEDAGERLVACWDAYSRTSECEDGYVLSGGARKQDRVLSEKMEELRSVKLELWFRDPEHFFSSCRKRWLHIPFIDCVRAVSGAGDGSYCLYDGETFLDMAKVLGKRHLDCPGAWVFMACPAGTEPGDACAACVSYDTGSSRRMWRDGRRMFRRWARRHAVDGAAYVRAQPALPWEWEDDLEDAMYAAFEKTVNGTRRE